MGVWPKLEDIEDPELKALARMLPSVVLQGKARSTVSKYSGAFARWKKWAEAKHEVAVFPVVPLHLCLYLSFLIQKSASVAPVEEAVNALSWVHDMAGVSNPTGHPLVAQVVAGAKRVLARPTVKKEPITADILGLLVRKFGQEGASLSDIRTLAVCLISFAGFFRYSEIANLKESDVCLYRDHLEIFVESSKTDQLRDGAWVVIARTSTELCPVAMLARYMETAAITGDPEKFLFRGLVNTKAGARLRPSGNLSYTRVRELVLEKLSLIGLDKSKFGLHSLRSGGASAAANAGVPDRWFKRHGRWKSENAKDGYVKDKLESRLEVSRRLGL
jgi:hypothetical protein